MIRTIAFFLIFWTVLLLSLFLLAFYFLLKLTRLKKLEKHFVFMVTHAWSRFVLFTAGIKLKISNLQNIPSSHSGFLVISNHQGNFDIPVFMASLPFSAGFIAKKELMKLPFLSSWMKALDCLPIDRKNPRESREKLVERIRRTDKNPMFLFPEGTRSKGPLMGQFRTGTLKLLFQNRMSVLPVTIADSYMCYEQPGNITGGLIKVYFHPLIDTGSYQVSEFEKFNSDLQRIISSPLKTEF